MRLGSGRRPLDTSFVILATEASVEAIFFSTFVLISQNKYRRPLDKRADLDLQINLRTERELTKVGSMVASVMQRLGIPAYKDREISDIAPEAVLVELEQDRPAERATARAVSAPAVS